MPSYYKKKPARTKKPVTKKPLPPPPLPWFKKLWNKVKLTWAAMFP